MRHVLAESERAMLTRVARSEVLLGFDFDGTLAPIVGDPDAAWMREGTRACLATVASRYPVVVISGRALDDLRPRLEGVALRAIVGNHGVESDEDAERFLGLVRRWSATLQATLGGLEGVLLEDKGYSLSVHYRHAPAPTESRVAIAERLATLEGARVVEGKMVFNVVPDGAAHKGDAMVRLRRDLGAELAMFVGDDVTDEDVFGADEPGRLLSVRVGRSARSQATHCLDTQGEIDALLGVLAELRAPG